MPFYKGLFLFFAIAKTKLLAKVYGFCTKKCVFDTKSGAIFAKKFGVFVGIGGLLRLGHARGLIAHRAIIQHPRAASLPYGVAVSLSAAVCGTRPISTKPVRARTPGLFIFIIHFPLRFGAIIHFTENPRRMQNFFIHFTVFERIKLTSARGIIYNIFVHFQNGSILTVTNKIFNKYTERHRL